MRRPRTSRVTPGPISATGPDPIRHAAHLGARVAPQQSPVLRVSRCTLGPSLREIKPIRVPGSEKPRGSGGWPPKRDTERRSGSVAKSLTGTATRTPAMSSAESMKGAGAGRLRRHSRDFSRRRRSGPERRTELAESPANASCRGSHTRLITATYGAAGGQTGRRTYQKPTPRAIACAAGRPNRSVGGHLAAHRFQPRLQLLAHGGAQDSAVAGHHAVAAQRTGQ